MFQQTECISCKTMAERYSSNLIAVQNAYSLCENPLQESDSDVSRADLSLIVHGEDIPWYEKWADSMMIPIDWFIDQVCKPYIEKTNALNPSWLKYLCHVAIVVGLILIPLSIVGCCVCCDRARARKANEEKEKEWKEKEAGSPSNIDDV